MRRDDHQTKLFTLSDKPETSTFAFFKHVIGYDAIVREGQEN
jgi:hypothetical protein